MKIAIYLPENKVVSVYKTDQEGYFKICHDSFGIKFCYANQLSFF